MPALSNNPALVVGVVLAVVLVVVVVCVVGRQMYQPRRVHFADPVVQPEDAAAPPPLEPAAALLEEVAQPEGPAAATQSKTFVSTDTSLSLTDIDARLASMGGGNEIDTEKRQVKARAEYWHWQNYGTRRGQPSKLTPRNYRGDRPNRDPTENRDPAKRPGGTVSGTF